MSTPITFTSSITAIDLPAAFTSSPDLVCEKADQIYLASGYGNTISPPNGGGPSGATDTLQYVTQKYAPAPGSQNLNNRACGVAGFPLPAKAFCAQYESCASTTINGAGQALTTAPFTLTVLDTSGFATSGTISVVTSSSPQSVTYTGLTGTTFTGCTVASGSFVAVDASTVTATSGCKDTCTGDSGGPMAVQTSTPNGWTLCGVVQSGTVQPNNGKPVCGARNEFGIYTSVGRSRAFIDAAIAGTAPIADDSQVNPGGGGTGNLFCFHESSLISYKGSKEVTLDAIDKGVFDECLIPHKFVGEGVSIITDCHAEPLRLSNDHLVFSKTHGLVAASKLRANDVVYADVDEKRTCVVHNVHPELQQTYMGLNCRESVVLANGVKCSTFESQHTIPYLWMKYVPSVIGLKRASVWGEFLSNMFRKVGLA